MWLGGGRGSPRGSFRDMNTTRPSPAHGKAPGGVRGTLGTEVGPQMAPPAVGPCLGSQWHGGVRGQLGAGSCPQGGCQELCIPQELSEDNVIPFFCCVGPCPYPPHVQCHQGSPSAPSMRPRRAQHEGVECDPSVPLQPLFGGLPSAACWGKASSFGTVARDQ